MVDTPKYDYTDEWENKTLNAAIKINMRKGSKQAISFINKEASKLQKTLEKLNEAKQI